MLFHARVFPLGWVGVQLFFVLSGYLITAILLSDRDQPLAAYLERFYWRRALRILPLYYGVIGGVALVGLVVGFPAAFRQQWPYLLTYTFNFARLLPDYIYPRYWGHLWSLAIEEQFYLAWPLIVHIARGAMLRAMLAAFFAGGLLFRLVTWWTFAGHSEVGKIVYNLTPSYLDAFAIGGALAAIPSLTQMASSTRVWVGVSVLTIAAGLFNHALFGQGFPVALGYQLNLPGGALPVWGYTMLNVWAASTLVLLLRPTKASRALAARPLVALGQRSYGVYVFHLPVLVLVERAWPWSLDSHSLAGLAGIGIYIAVTLMVSAASYRWFERPFLNLKDARMTGFLGPATIGKSHTLVTFGDRHSSDT